MIKMLPNASAKQNTNHRVAFSIQEIARSVGASRSFVRLEIARMRLKAHRVGRRVFILNDDFENWLRGR